MPTWNEKKAKAEEHAINKELEGGGGFNDVEASMAKDVRAAAMGGGDEDLFGKVMSKEEKKAAKAEAKAARDAKKSLKKSTSMNSIKKSSSTNSLKKNKKECQHQFNKS